MESDLQQLPAMFLDHQHNQHQHQQQMNSGLTRFKSAPSSYFSNIIDKDFYEHLFNRPSSPETERVFARFMNSLGSDSEAETAAVNDSLSQNQNQNDISTTVQHQQLPVVKEEIDQQSQAALKSMNNEQPVILQQQSNTTNNNNNNMNMNNYGSSAAPPQQSFYQSSGRPPLPNQMKTGRGTKSNLIRHGSSPAGLFSSINIETGFAAVRGMGTLGAGSNAVEETNFSPTVRSKNAPNFSPILVSTGADIGNSSNTQSNNLETEGFLESRGNDFMPGFPVSSWEDSVMMPPPDNITGMKRYRDDDDVKPLSGVNAAEIKNETGGQPAAPLAHQLSMPNTTAELAAIEKFLQFSDSVPCKIRAKRGMATHPRSIAERVRRTKISERMRKLQDLVPNMDKQTNTADMLDLAVDYIKGLQKQVETLSDSRAKCTCSHSKPR